MRTARWKFVGPSLLALVTLTAALVSLSRPEAEGAHPATGVGSCTLKGWNPNTDPNDATDLPEGQRPQTYKRDDYNCTGAKFAANGVEFARFPQPNNFHVDNKKTVMPVATCQNGTCNQLMKAVLQPAATSNPLAPYFPPFQHFVILYRETPHSTTSSATAPPRSRPAARAWCRGRTTSVLCPTSTRLPRPTR
jgi:hypothetical protein